MSREDLQKRVGELSQSLKTRGTSYDRVFARTEGLATIASAGLFAFGGAALEADQFVLGFVLLGLGLIATTGSVLLLFWRERGSMETIVEAVNASREAIELRLEAEKDIAEAKHALSDQKRLTKAAKEQGAAELAAAQRNLEQLDSAWKLLDRRRRARSFAVRKMIENAEAALLHKADVKTSAQKMLEDANEHIREAVRCRTEDYFTLSIFRRETRSASEGERMYRIACYATVTKEKSYDDLSWAKGKGYTGTLWNDAAANAKARLVLPDTTLPGIREKYPVDNYDPERESRYVSVAAFPILIERTENVWGIAIATADRKNAFNMEDVKSRQGVEMVADVAYVTALLASVDARS